MHNDNFYFQYVSWTPLAVLNMQHDEAGLQTKKIDYITSGSYYEKSELLDKDVFSKAVMFHLT